MASLLRKQGKSLGTIEFFTGGLLASNLGEEESSGEFLRGSVVAGSTQVLESHGVDGQLISRAGLASSEVAEAMAVAARRHFGADVGLGVSGVVTEPTADGVPVGTCHMGYALGDRAVSTSGGYATQRHRIRHRAVTHALLGLAQLLRDERLHR